MLIVAFEIPNTTLFFARAQSSLIFINVQDT